MGKQRKTTKGGGTMNKVKYVIVKDNGMLVPIIFFGSMEHKKMAGLGEVISAGFISFETKDSKIICKCFGESNSLGIKSKGPEDEIIINTFMFKDEIK